MSHYQIEGVIGRGGMGEVYKAQDEKLPRMVALKVLPSEFTSDPEHVRRFEHEALAASKLNHPNIITIFETILSDGHHCIVEEYVEGQTLRQLMTGAMAKSQGRLSMEKATDIAIQVANALKAAHTAWIIHRDIKPENIMVRADGVVKVLDFGIAKQGQFGLPPSNSSSGDRNAPTSSLHQSARAFNTVPGAVIGTASYMSPEQGRGEQLDGRTDLFSLGAVLYEMAVGERLPGSDRKIGSKATDVESVQSARDYRFDRIPKELERIIRKAVRHNREERYQSAAEMLANLLKLKRRLENRGTRRIARLSLMGVLVLTMLAIVSAWASLRYSWDERILRDGHRAAVRRAVFSPDGRLLISVGEDHQVIVWDFAHRQRLKTLNEHKDIVNIIAFSPDGKWFATGGEDALVIIWDAARLEKTAVFAAHQGPVRALAVSPDGNLLASASSSSTGTIVWTVGDWKQIRQMPWGHSFGNLFFLDNHRLAGNSGQIQDLSTGQTLREGNDRIGGNWATMSPNGRRWVAVSSAGEVKLFDLPTMNSLGLVRGHHDHARSAAFSPDGKLLATAAERVVLWDANNVTKIAPLEYEAMAWSVTFSPDGRWLVSTHADGAILIWDVVQRERVSNFNQHSDAVHSVAVSVDGRMIASGSEDRSIIIWDAERDRKQTVLTGHNTRVMAVQFSPDGKWLVSCDQDGTIICWDIEQRRPRWAQEGTKQNPNYTVDVSDDGRWVAASNGIYESYSGRRVIDYAALKREIGWEGHIYGTAFLPDGLLAFVTPEGNFVIWNIERNQLVSQIRSKSDLNKVSCSSSGTRLVTGSDDGTVRLWQREPLREVALLGRHAARVKSVAFSPDGESAASAGDDKTIAVWDVNQRKLITHVGTHTSPVYSVAFSPDGRWLASGEHDASVRIYKRHRTLWGFRIE